MAMGIKVINGTLRCWACVKENTFYFFNISAFTSSIASVGTDLFKELFGSGGCSSYSSVADSSFTGTHLKYCKIDITTLM